MPFARRRPGRRGDRRPRSGVLRVPATAIALALAVTGAALLAACGGSPGGAASPSASPTTAAPCSRPLAGSPRQAVAAYWALVDAGDYQGLEAACSPGSAAALTAVTDDIEHARLLSVVRVSRQPGGGAQVEADVRIVPAGQATPWGAPGTHTLFVDLAQTSGGGWLVTGWGTSP